MEFLKNLSESIENAVDFVVEKNKKFNKINKIKSKIKKESNNMVEFYIKLGEHYYQDLRDVPNQEMQDLCNKIDDVKLEIKNLQEKLIKITHQESLSDYKKFLKDEGSDKIKTQPLKKPNEE